MKIKRKQYIFKWTYEKRCLRSIFRGIISTFLVLLWCLRVVFFKNRRNISHAICFWQEGRRISLVLESISPDRAQLHPQYSDSPNYRYITFNFCAIFQVNMHQVVRFFSNTQLWSTKGMYVFSSSQGFLSQHYYSDWPTIYYY